MRNAIRKWFHPEPVVVRQKPVLVEEVDAAAPPSPEVAEESKAVQTALVHEILSMVRESAYARNRLTHRMLQLHGRKA